MLEWAWGSPRLARLGHTYLLDDQDRLLKDLVYDEAYSGEECESEDYFK